MKINKIELQNALAKVKPGLANRELIEQSTSFAFLGDRVVTYNDEISISHPVQNLDVRGAIKAQALYAYLSKIKKDEIDVEWEENQVRITAGKAVAGLVFEQEVRLPVEAVGEIGEWHPLPDKFIECLRFCYPCCSCDMTRPTLTCVHVHKDCMEATDSFQIVRCLLGGDVSGDEFLLPATTVRELVKYDVKDIASGKQGWVHFRAEGDTVFSCRIFDGAFPEIGSHLGFEGIRIDFPKTTVEALGRAAVFCGSDSADYMRNVTVEIEEGNMKISAKGESGWFEEVLRIRYEGTSIKFKAGVDFLCDLLPRVQACVFGDGKIKFVGDNWTHVSVTMAAE